MAKSVICRGKDSMARRKTQQTPEMAVQKIVDDGLSANAEVRLVLGIAAHAQHVGSFDIPMYFEESRDMTAISVPGQSPGLQETP